MTVALQKQSNKLFNQNRLDDPNGRPAKA